MTKKSTSALSTFLEIVQIDSPTGQEQKMTEYVYQRLNSYGLNPKIDESGNVHAFLDGNSDLEPIFLNAHLDTVEPGKGIKPFIDSDDWIKSDGTTILGGDNKSSVAAILESVKKLIDSKTFHRSIDLLFTVAEEGDSHGAINFDYTQLKSKNGFSFDISNEEFGTVFVSAPFYNRLTINLVGKSAHAKAPEKAINVLPAFIKAMSQLPLGRFSPNTVVNVGTIHGGTAVNAIPGQMALVGEVRSSIETELEKVTDLYRQSFTDSVKNTGIILNFIVHRENPGFKIDPSHPFLKESLILLTDFGLKPIAKDSFGCADANFFATHGLTTINISDGTLASHTVEEKVSINNLNRLVDLILFLTTH